MKKIVFLIFGIALLLFSTDAFAQVDRRIGKSQYKRTANKKVDVIEVSIDFLKKELNLDPFQEAAAKTLLLENQEEGNKILAMEISDNEKKDKLQAALNKFDSQIEGILNPSQLKLYETVKEKRKKSK